MLLSVTSFSRIAHRCCCCTCCTCRAQSDPKGDIPAFAVNMAMSNQPASLKLLRDHVGKMSGLRAPSDPVKFEGMSKFCLPMPEFNLVLTIFFVFLYLVFVDFLEAAQKNLA
jgi:hypothetical protein